MKYIDILTDAMEHFTTIPRENIKKYIYKFSSGEESEVKLLKTVMEIEFPRPEGEVLLEDLKSKNFADTIEFLKTSLMVYRQEVIRQSLVN